VIALIDGLRRVGSQRVLPPACQLCGRIQPLVPSRGQRDASMVCQAAWSHVR
jgi:hypothetical protein